VYVGASMLLSRGKPASLPVAAATPAAAPLRSVFSRGFLTNTLNPKVALFFLAFVPQFIPHDAPHPSLSFLLLGLLFNFNGMWVNFGWAGAAAWMARRVGLVARGVRWLERVAGAIFIGFGIQLALADAPRH